MTESQEKPLATWLMENIVKGDGSEYLDFEEISSKLVLVIYISERQIERRGSGTSSAG